MQIYSWSYAFTLLISSSLVASQCEQKHRRQQALDGSLQHRKTVRQLRQQIKINTLQFFQEQRARLQEQESLEEQRDAIAFATTGNRTATIIAQARALQDIDDLHDVPQTNNMSGRRPPTRNSPLSSITASSSNARAPLRNNLVTEPLATARQYSDATEEKKSDSLTAQRTIVVIASMTMHATGKNRSQHQKQLRVGTGKTAVTCL